FVAGIHPTQLRRCPPSPLLLTLQPPKQALREPTAVYKRSEPVRAVDFQVMATPSSPCFVLKGGAFLLRLTPLLLWLTSSSLYGAYPGAEFGREPDEVTGGVATQM
ncbi:unnamed protein product, partial [Musa hybrid cultivar]